MIFSLRILAYFHVRRLINKIYPNTNIDVAIENTGYGSSYECAKILIPKIVLHECENELVEICCARQNNLLYHISDCDKQCVDYIFREFKPKLTQSHLKLAYSVNKLDIIDYFIRNINIREYTDHELNSFFETIVETNNKELFQTLKKHQSLKNIGIWLIYDCSRLTGSVLFIDIFEEYLHNTEYQLSAGEINAIFTNLLLYGLDESIIYFYEKYKPVLTIDLPKVISVCSFNIVKYIISNLSEEEIRDQITLNCIRFAAEYGSLKKLDYVIDLVNKYYRLNSNDYYDSDEELDRYSTIDNDGIDYVEDIDNIYELIGIGINRSNIEEFSNSESDDSESDDTDDRTRNIQKEISLSTNITYDMRNKQCHQYLLSR
jgi:hypothetical protein